MFFIQRNKNGKPSCFTFVDVSNDWPSNHNTNAAGEQQQQVISSSLCFLLHHTDVTSSWIQIVCCHDCRRLNKTSQTLPRCQKSTLPTPQRKHNWRRIYMNKCYPPSSETVTAESPPPAGPQLYSAERNNTFPSVDSKFTLILVMWDWPDAGLQTKAGPNC